jgi:hypothetical protein
MLARASQAMIFGISNAETITRGDEIFFNGTSGPLELNFGQPLITAQGLANYFSIQVFIFNPISSVVESCRSCNSILYAYGAEIQTQA